MSNQLKGVWFAVLDGVLLAFWGISSKAFASYDPGAYEYSMVLGVAGIGHLLLTFIPEGKKAVTDSSFKRSIIFLLIAFVLISVSQFYLGVKVYEYKDADVAVSSFLRNSSLIFAAIIAHFAKFFGGMFVESKLTRTSIFGSFLFMLGIWMFFEAPLTSNNASSYLSFWVLGSLLIGFNRSITELLMQTFAKDISRTLMNFVIGGGFLIIGLLGAAFFQKSVVLNSRATFYLACVALIIPVMQAIRYSAFQYLNEVLGKKGFTIWAYLLFSMLLGGIFFGESLSPNKWAGLAVGMVAVLFLDKNTLRAVRG